MGIKGAILGDIAGSRFERYPIFRYDYIPSIRSDKNLNGEEEYKIFTDICRFTDDTVMSIATMKAFKSNKDYATAYREMYARYPNSGYGKAFNSWARDPNAKAYGSFGNGSAMRVGCLGEAMKNNPFKFMVEREAKRTAKVSHNHPEGIKGAVTTAVCVWMAERGKSKEAIQEYLYKQYPDKKYGIKQFEDLAGTESAEKRNAIKFSTKCQDTVPMAIQCFLQTENFFDCMSLINSMECDTDTIGAIAGAVCESYYGKCTNIDNDIIKAYLTTDLQKDLEMCGIHLSTTNNKKWTKFHDSVEERYIQEAMEIPDMEEYMMYEEYDPWEEYDYECAGQMSLDDFLTSLEHSIPENNAYSKDEYPEVLTKDSKDNSINMVPIEDIIYELEGDGDFIESMIEQEMLDLVADSLDSYDMLGEIEDYELAD